MEFALPVTNGGLAKLGASTLTLSGANTYSGGTSINADLATGTAGTVGSGDVEVAPGAICDLRNATGAVADTASVSLTGLPGDACRRCERAGGEVVYRRCAGQDRHLECQS